MSEKVKLTIDGKVVEAVAGSSLIQVAMDNGTMVPHFCYHPGIGIEGSCRLCLVQIEGMPKLATSCTIPVKEGMVVHTQSPEAKQARKGVLEFFLLNHPLDCPFCDKGGECPLQNFTLDSGQFTTRFAFQKIHKAKHQVIGEHIILDKERCVLCDRCVRFGRDLAGHEELQIGMRGSHAEIFVPEGEQLRSKFTGNYADICPVGALTSRSFRFKARPWEMKTENTICGECSVGCNVQVWKKETQVLRLTPRIARDVNEWWLCDKGRFSIDQHLVESRLTHIYKNEHATWLTTPASDFVHYSKEHFKNGNAVGIVADPTSTNEEFVSLKQIAASVPNVKVYLPFTSASRDFAKALKSSRLGLTSAADLETSGTIVVAGENLEDAHPVLALRVRRLVKTKGKKLFTVGASSSDLSDVRVNNIDTEDASTYFSHLKATLEGKNQDLGEFTALTLLISDSWVTAASLPKLLEVLEAAKQVTNKTITFCHLVHGSNARGLMDLADEAVGSIDDFTVDLDLSKINSVFWLAQQDASHVLASVEKKGFLTACVSMHSHNKPKTTWLIPGESFVEKRGTYTNLFGKVQVLRKVKRVVLKGEAISEIISDLRNQLAGGQLNTSELYQLVVKTKADYPQTMETIPESKETYHHYERALWR